MHSFADCICCCILACSWRSMNSMPFKERAKMHTNEFATLVEDTFVGLGVSGKPKILELLGDMTGSLVLDTYKLCNVSNGVNTRQGNEFYLSTINVDFPRSNQIYCNRVPRSNISMSWRQMRILLIRRFVALTNFTS